MPPAHPPEFRQRAVELAREGSLPVTQIARDLGISNSCLRNWMARADADEHGSSQRLASSEKRSWLSCASGTGCWSRRTRYSAAPQPTLRGRTSSRNSVPAGP